MYQILSQRTVKQMRVRFTVEHEDPGNTDALDVLVAQGMSPELEDLVAGSIIVSHDWTGCWTKTDGADMFKAEIDCVFEWEVS